MQLQVAMSELLDLFKKQYLIRRFEEKALELFKEGELNGTVHTCIGQESIAVGVTKAMDFKIDSIFTNHRGHGHFLAATDNVDGLMAELMGRATGVCGGIGGSQHLCDQGVYSNGIQGGILPCAAGMALGKKLSGQGGLVGVFMGDGTLGEGVVYETFNIASLWKLPLLIVLENNHYAQTTPVSMAVAGSIVKRPQAFGIESLNVNGRDIVDVITKTKTAVEYIRKNSAPYFLHMDTYRLMAHSKGDDTRSQEEVQNHWLTDPLKVLESALPVGEIKKIKDEVGIRIETAVQRAKLAPTLND